jgi:hypothetical protein
MAFARPFRPAPTSQGRRVAAGLADALDQLLVVLDGLPAEEHSDETRRHRGSWRGRTRREAIRFVELLSLRLRRSQRRPYRIIRLVAGCVAGGCVGAAAGLITVRFLPLW